MRAKVEKPNKSRVPRATEEDAAKLAAEIVSNGLQRFTEGLERFNKLKKKVNNRIDQGGRRSDTPAE